jgi:hypothetical protein
LEELEQFRTRAYQIVGIYTYPYRQFGIRRVRYKFWSQFPFWFWVETGWEVDGQTCEEQERRRLQPQATID